MWKLILDCKKELTVNSMVRQIRDGAEDVYTIIVAEKDQYILQRMVASANSSDRGMTIRLSPEQLIHFRFEVAVK